jgi:hypothetical protein
VTAVVLTTPGLAQENRAEVGEALDAIDTWGTNPAVLTRTFQISNEYRWLPDNQFFNQTLLRYTEPFFDGKASARLTVPQDATDLTCDDEFGLGDVSAKFSYVAYVSRRQAFILSTEIYARTATEDVLGTGKWVRRLRRQGAQLPAGHGGWNYMIRLYRPRPEILDSTWKFPEAQAVK